MFSLTVVAVFSIVAMLLAWLWQKNHANAGIVDVVWAYGMMLAGPWYALTGSAPLELKLSLGLLTFSWFLRLGFYLQRRVLSESEDGRYHAMRNAMKDRVDIGFLLFFYCRPDLFACYRCLSGQLHKTLSRKHHWLLPPCCLPL